MILLRFIFPFLFVRNWYDGTWEISRVRFIFFCVLVAFVLVGVGLAYMLQMPVVYTASSI